MNASTVVVIGATSGVGRATARQLSDAGHRVLAIGRDPERAQSLRQALVRTGDASAIDISTRSGWDAAAD
jgi:NADP-dependent 3-hydroxy acid dehydrogenase YdfG